MEMLTVLENYIWIDHLSVYIGVTSEQLSRLSRDPRINELGCVTQREKLTKEKHGVSAVIIRSYHTFAQSELALQNNVITSGHAFPGVNKPLTASSDPLPTVAGGFVPGKNVK